MERIIYKDPEELKKKETNFIRAGGENLHLLADFDRTLTRAFVNGEYVPSVIWVLYHGDYLTGDYNKRAQALHERYHNIETDPDVPKEEKTKAMKEWWEKQFALLVRSGLNKKHIQAIVDSGKIKLREGVKSLITKLRDNNIPLVIMSSSGLGGDAISMLLKKEGLFFDNIYIISNSFKWDEQGNAISVEEPIIHGMRKYETAVQDYPFFNRIEKRKNVILMGDNLDDVGMIEGFDYNNLIKVGFLNKKVEEQKKNYLKAYDVVVLNDGSVEYINKLINKII